MALSVNSNFSVNCALPIDSRFVLSKEQMLNANPNIIPDVYFCVCSDDGGLYLYNKDNVENAETGKYEKLVGGGGQIIQVDVLSEAVQSDVGKIYQYIGETTDEFTNGYFYKCIANDDGTYSWSNIPVQEDNGNTSLSFWQPNTEYKVNDSCLYKNTDYYSLYICTTEHTSTDAFVSAYWETIDGTEFEGYTEDELLAMLNLTQEELDNLQNIINDNEVQTDHVWSSSKVYTEIINCLIESKNFTIAEVAKIVSFSYKVVTSEDEVIDDKAIYLIENSSGTYDMYLLVDGSPSKVGNTNINLEGYIKKEDIIDTFDGTATYTDSDKVFSTKASKSMYDDLNTKISNMQSNFQDGVDTLYDTCVGCGATPTDKTPTAIAEAIKLLAQSNMWWKDWLGLGGISTDIYSRLDGVLDDATALNILMKKHASVDYLINELSNNTEALDIIVNDENAMTYIGTYDYCADKMLANRTISTALLSSTYWKCILKDHVPTMKSATSPRGKVLVSSSLGGYNDYAVFDKKDNTFWASNMNSTSTPTEYLGYRFDNPNCVRKIYFKNRTNSDAPGVKSPINIIVQASNNGSNWIDLLSYTNNNTTSAYETYIDIENSDYYLYYRLYMTGVLYNERNICLAEVDFFGRSLNVSVPTMTSNTSPEGEAIFSSRLNVSGWDGYVAFTEGTALGWVTNNTLTGWIGYKFRKPICVKKVKTITNTPTDWIFNHSGAIEASNDSVNWVSLCSFSGYAGSNKTFYENLDNTTGYTHYRLNIKNSTTNQPFVGIARLQFYGVDYSE